MAAPAELPIRRSIYVTLRDAVWQMQARQDAWRRQLQDPHLKNFVDIDLDDIVGMLDSLAIEVTGYGLDHFIPTDPAFEPDGGAFGAPLGGVLHATTTRPVTREHLSLVAHSPKAE